MWHTKKTTHTTVNWKRPCAPRARPRDCAREREIERAVHKRALASGRQTTGSTSACLKHSNFLKVSKHTVSAVHVKPSQDVCGAPLSFRIDVS